MKILLVALVVVLCSCVQTPPTKLSGDAKGASNAGQKEKTTGKVTPLSGTARAASSTGTK